MLKIRIIRIKVISGSIKAGAVMPTLEGLRLGSNKNKITHRGSWMAANMRESLKGLMRKNSLMMNSARY